MKKLFLLTILCLIVDLSWAGCASNGYCISGWGIYNFDDGQKYVGEFNDGRRNGQGTYTALTGEKYVGQWKDDKRNGQGTNIWPNGEKYVGRWKDGKRNGEGTYTWLDSNYYEGSWIEDGFSDGTIFLVDRRSIRLRGGEYSLYAANGSRLAVGKNHLRRPDFPTIRAESIKNKSQSVTRLAKQYKKPKALVKNYGLLPVCDPGFNESKNNCYGAELDDGWLMSVGRYNANRLSNGYRIYDSNSVYIGSFNKEDFSSENKPHGKGIRVSPNSQTLLKGEWNKGALRKEFSRRKLSDLDACSSYRNIPCFGVKEERESHYVGEFEKGIFAGFGMLFETTGYYSGFFRDGEFHGEGEYVFASGAHYVGDYVSGDRHGLGVFKYPDGGSYEGEFLRGNANGDAVRFYADGRVWMGEYKNGKKAIKSREFLTRGEYAFYMENQDKDASLARGFVREVQRLLTSHRYYAEPLDGIVGSLTKNSMVQVLQDVGQEVREARLSSEILESDPEASLETVSRHLRESDVYCEKNDDGPSPDTLWSMCFSIQN